VALSIFIGGVANILYLSVVGVLQWRRDDVLSTRPFTQIDRTASITAERKVFAGLNHGLLADRTLELDPRVARHKSIVDGKREARRMQFGSGGEQH
jgi:hypothetical protein